MSSSKIIVCVPRKNRERENLGTASEIGRWLCEKDSVRHLRKVGSVREGRPSYTQEAWGWGSKKTPPPLASNSFFVLGRVHPARVIHSAFCFWLSLIGPEHNPPKLAPPLDFNRPKNPTNQPTKKARRNPKNKQKS